MFITPLFYTGQRVICVNADFAILLAQNPAIQVPIQDTVYTIRRNLQFSHDVGLLLQGLYNEPVPGSKVEPNFSQSRFRAVQEHPAQVLAEDVSYADAV